MATYYAVNAGGNRSAGGTWSTTAAKDASRTGGAIAPTNADTCILDDYSGNITIDTTTCTCKNINCATNGNYAGTLTFTAAKILIIVTTGSVVFSPVMSFSGTGQLTLNGNISLTSNGVTFPCNVAMGTSNTTKTLVDNWSISGLLTITGGAIQNINKTGAGAGDSLTLTGGLTNNGTLQGTTTIYLNGGTWTGSGTTNAINITIGGNITIGASFIYKTGTLSYVSGTVSFGTTTMTFGNDATIACDGLLFNDIILNGTNITLSENLSIAGTLDFGLNGLLVGAGNITCANLIHYGVAINSTLTLPFGTILTITNSLYLNKASSGEVIINSSTASSPANINFSGTVAKSKIFGIVFTDIDASSSAIPLDNWYGGIITRCTNVNNITSANLARTSDASKILTGQTVGGVSGSASGGSSDVFGIIG